ncbi:TIGR03915 family putative DNA repair protein [Bacteroidales bacterium OttesenSCG-928-L03]|nr:TIGR03915 family putative DNA repair protein [Bacteroidales bacterium OttesenSCG-928-L03]
MLYYIYDNTYEGLMTAVFDAFARKEKPDRIVPEGHPLPLFTDTHTVISEREKAERVLNGLKKKLSPSALSMLSVCFLSESDEVPMHILRYIEKTFASPISIEVNFADEDVLKLSQIYRRVTWEANRMKQFVRFQKTGDVMFFALIEPDYNVLPLCYRFFEDRYADQAWIIYDRKRHYGVYYDLKKTEVVYFEKPEAFLQAGKLSQEKLDEQEQAFQKLWKNYLGAITIKERKNLKLQRQHMPVRYWKYLTEKS